MGRLSTRSNPTSLQDIDKRKVEIVVSEINEVKYFSLQKLDLGGMNLSPAHRVVCVARAGKTSRRFEMGTIARYRNENIRLEELDLSQALRFRIMVHEESNALLLASAENLRPRDESASESLLPMEPADLGQLLWKLDFSAEGPVLKFNSNVFPSAGGIENYLPFASLVLPAVVRSIVEKIANQPNSLEDDNDPLSSWADWLDVMGLERPEELDDDQRTEWCDRVVDTFCNRHSFATRLGAELAARSINND